ncbi:MAG: glycosyltransferase [Pseudomonadota bacterium]
MHPMTLVGGRLMGSDGKEQAGSRRGEITPWTALVELFRLDRMFPGRQSCRRINFHEATLPDQAIPVPTISGACMFLPREDYWVIGGMDEHYFLHGEDVDFCRRFREAGGNVLFCPQVEVIHEKGSSHQSPVRIERWKAQGLTRYFRIHFSGDYPWGVVSAVCGLVWLGFGFRAAKSKITALFRS